MVGVAITHKRTGSTAVHTACPGAIQVPGGGVSIVLMPDGPTVPVTTPERAIRDVHATQASSEIVRQAISDGRRTGYLTWDRADRLERELLDSPPRWDWEPSVPDLNEALERVRDLMARILAQGPSMAGSRTAAQDRPPQA